ncbi:MAG: CoA-transferase [Epulopiscium sp. Nuni2H_MBin003]|nr:MAG: CoA-transferase [Epulopiscium sp. Nuni2H_MBin003]
MKSKLTNIVDAIKLIEDHHTLGVGGNVLHRAPMALVREIARAKKKSLKVIKTAGAMDVDVLCAAKCVESVDAGFISYESEYGFANFYRKAVQLGEVKANEHACYTVISALRAASFGVSFMPVKGMQVSDLIDANDYFKQISDPFTNEMVTVVRAIRPDVTIVHVQEADMYGNAKIYGPVFDDYTLITASKKVIISAEKIIDTSEFMAPVNIPHFMVDAVVKVEGGAIPNSCDRFYDIDVSGIEMFRSNTNIDEYLRKYEHLDRRG